MDPLTSTEVATSQLREAILSGALKPGEKLHQDRLAEMLQISRTPLRAALTTLSQTGLVSYESNRGFYVREFSFADVAGAFTVRAQLEALACRLAAENMTEKDANYLFKLVADGDALLEKGALLAEHLPEYRQMNVGFHTTIIGLAKNPWIQIFVENLQNVPIASDRIIIWRDFDVIKRSHDDHRRIARALSKQQGERAAAIMHEHVLFAFEHLQEHLKLYPQDFLRMPLAEKPAKSRLGSSKNRRRTV
ncbi:GntR family transcriptional regulator [Ochrobactrum sp. Q0168]|uniref:GntR family transcriptional regulator n=1 Tax=Ochrobactrum sp. Q0168 TaxID=2793241 RepID=UPI0018EE4136|nr:GntR family transcriptional regulator [Ochrobactrum sp. Q0168]